MRRFFWFSLLFLTRLVLFPIYALSGVFRRRKDLWVFGSWGGHRYADNAAAFFEYCQEHLPETELVWISRRSEIVEELRARGFDAHRTWSPVSIIKCLRAGVFLFDCFSKDINFWLSRGAMMVNLWSGIPLKKVERDIDHPDSRYYQLFHGSTLQRWLLAMMMPWHVRRPDLIIATSEEMAEITRHAFDIPASRVAVTGFPRNDILFGAPTGVWGIQTASNAFAEAMRRGRTRYIYLPTYRDSGRPFLRMDWGRLDQFLQKVDADFFFKFHPIDRGRFEGRSSRIFELPQEVDVHALLPHTQVLITDYSSIGFDYMLLGHPIIYYVPDIEEFVSENRSLYFDPIEIAAGPVCRSFDELLEELAAVTERPPPENRERILRRLHTHPDGHSSARVLCAIREKTLS